VSISNYWIIVLKIPVSSSSREIPNSLLIGDAKCRAEGDQNICRARGMLESGVDAKRHGKLLLPMVRVFGWATETGA
jgi:hypothetical protein